MKHGFSSKTIESIDYYVYVLVDPLDKKIFYIGKGKGNRVFSHVENVKKKMCSNHSFQNNQKDKESKIAEILSRNKNNEVITYIVRYGLTNEHALLIESVLIDVFKHKLDVSLSDIDSIANEANGYETSKGCVSTEDLENYFSGKNVADLNDGSKYLAINISLLSKDPEEIYNRVRFSWKLNKETADQADYILATHAGLILGVYKLDAKKWCLVEEKVESTSLPRYYFNEDPDAELTDVRKRLVGSLLPKKRERGAANPIWYIAGWK